MSWNINSWRWHCSPDGKEANCHQNCDWLIWLWLIECEHDDMMMHEGSASWLYQIMDRTCDLDHGSRDLLLWAKIVPGIRDFDWDWQDFPWDTMTLHKESGWRRSRWDESLLPIKSSKAKSPVVIWGVMQYQYSQLTLVICWLNMLENLDCPFKEGRNEYTWFHYTE